ncbi:MAG TPA: DNA-processing protein DprA [Candidatus Corynebacterium gallistercoris]|uniref:DNA-processing protein DprA n=1 Tax=Candidatus Corynebacterium gallistercoris TaxID=2838530 RepID=A0A9D1RZ27_9CORY|nr:DNA-processing protein DprA [Candidatus Corynebacterium gallistercoris]
MEEAAAHLWHDHNAGKEQPAERFSKDPRADQQLAHTNGWRLVTPDSPDWPLNLTSAFAPSFWDEQADDTVRGQSTAPFALWVAGTGSLDSLTKKSITIVGTRAITGYGADVTRHFATELGREGYTIVSGGADGVDRIAHTQALEDGNNTAAILACGVDVPYPRKNQEMLNRIKDSGGLIISEYAPGTPPARHRFLTRNRLVAGISQGTLMTEAPYRSGAINTMNWAESMGRPTFAVPGPITSVSSQGCLVRLAEHRATMALRAEDIRAEVEPLGTQLELDWITQDGSSTQRLLSWEQTAVFDAAGTQSDSAGTLATMIEDTGLSVHRVMVTIRELEDFGLIVRHADRWVKTR